MKRIAACLLAISALVAVAQTFPTPQPVDWRYRFQWEDPNPAGTVTNWTVYASNFVAVGWTPIVRTVQTRTLAIDYQPLLSGAPAGTYAIFVIPVSALGDIGEPSTNHFVLWPGGNGGKLLGGRNLRSGK